jgi:hypothetical protein
VPRTAIVLVLVALAAALLVPAALAASVHVRVEGKTQTIFGGNEPLVVADNALQTLEQASLAGEFYYHVKQFSFGPFVDQIGRYPGEGSAGWSVKVNGSSPQVGADQVTVKDGDRVLWYWNDFSSGSGYRTLRVVRAADRCYQATLQDDTGRETPAVGAVLHVDGKTLATGSFGRKCLSRHRSLVFATLDGAVRSNRIA